MYLGLRNQDNDHRFGLHQLLERKLEDQRRHVRHQTEPYQNVIHTVDRPKLAEALAKAIVKSGRAPRLSIEVNIGREPQKAGIMPEALPEFLTYCRDSLGLKIQGLMCIPPQGEDPRPFFQQMKKLADQHHLPNLSMGMSADFEDAIMCGATEVRVGSAIFGERFLH